MRLEFTPLEFETRRVYPRFWIVILPIRIYSVGVWNDKGVITEAIILKELEFTPLEFETNQQRTEFKSFSPILEFTPLEFETRP